MSAKSANLSKGDWRDVGLMAETLSGVNIAQVNFDDWQLNRSNRIHDRDRGMRIGPCIKDNASM